MGNIHWHVSHFRAPDRPNEVSVMLSPRRLDGLRLHKALTVLFYIHNVFSLQTRPYILV